ncbi:MAG TPA: hypothetical protein VHT00_14165 [Stellaceae bacterium]|jgi:hypothetical protein|nr:hypothetical protein [Stellaceae bacterium]
MTPAVKILGALALLLVMSGAPGELAPGRSEFVRYVDSLHVKRGSAYVLPFDRRYPTTSRRPGGVVKAPTRPRFWDWPI